MASHSIHKQEKEQFVKLFKQDRIDRFNDRLAVLDVFLRTEHHVTAKDLTELVNRNGHRLSAEFVTDTIDLMCRYGFAQKNRFNNGESRYEHRHLGQHHDHMICTKCRKIIEFEDSHLEQLQLKIAAAKGFHLLQHKMELYGLCRQCLDKRELLYTLDAAKGGERLLIKGFVGGAKSRLRLLAMGLRIDDEVEVITNMMPGQLVIGLDYKRLVIGHGLAQKIQVAPVIKGEDG
ncbi:MAG: transcriptional repressor [Desulfobacteraceae bacterium]|jgi:Fur family ferric uptake transcriptional regulator